MKKTIITLAVVLTALLANAQVKKQQPKIYQSTTQKILKGKLADATEEIVHHKVTISVLLNKFNFVYPNKEREDVSVKMTSDEWKSGVAHEDYMISSHATVNQIYFARDINQIWLDFKDGTTIIYNLTVPKKKR